MMNRFNKYILLSIVFPLHFIFSQQIKLPDDYIIEKRTVIPGEEYKAGNIYEFFFGKHWRDLWTTPISVPVINLDKFAGGITPLKKGGGFQTKSLRFINKVGIQYKFRSLDKDPGKTLPVELQETVAEDILQDQISSSNPLAALVVVPLLNSVGILQAEPILCILPDDEKLGEYKSEFGGLLGMIEIHPDVDDSVSFYGADKIDGTFDLLNRFEKDNDEWVNSTDYLTARLIDIFLGDWDRHTDQWRWARFEVNKIKIWSPIPRDRDQAMAKFDGLFPGIAAMAITQLEGFSDTYPEIEDLTWSGRHLDRRFLIQLTKTQWDSVTNYVMGKLTDSLIEYSVQRLPAEMYKIAGVELTQTLKIRRDKLPEASELFFRNIFKYVDIRGSNKDEYADVNRINDNEVEVSLYKKDNDTGEKKGKPIFHRLFNDEYTKEIRVMLYDGDDKAVVRGKTNSSIPVYIAGDGGKDELIDTSKVNGHLFGFIPFINSAENITFFYDDGRKTNFILGEGTVIKDKALPEPKDDFEKYEPQLQTWGHDWRFGPWFGINPDDGLFIGGGPILYEFGFRTRPYVYRMTLALGFATSTKKYKARYWGEFYSILEHNKITLEIRSSGLEIINFFGFGNNTTRKGPYKKSNFYKAKQQQNLINAGIEIFSGKYTTINLNYKALFTDTDLEGQTLISITKPYGTEDLLINSFSGEFEYDSRNNNVIPVEGVLLKTFASFYPSTSRELNSFSKIKASVSSYIPFFSFPYSTLALRLSGEKIWGKYPFFETAFLGGLESLRGFERNRFAGDASLSVNAELRICFTKFKFIVPIYLGAAIFTDAGRVFLSGEASKKWHKSFGGGLWFSFIYPDMLFSFYGCNSDDDKGFYLSSGFAF